MIRIEKEIELNGEDLAREFWEQDCLEQAEFFNKNKLKEDKWNHGRALFQIDNFVANLDDDGREFIKRIYDSMKELEREMVQEHISEESYELDEEYDTDVSDCVINCSTCKNNVEFPPPHTCDICTSLDQDEEYGMWEAKD